MSIFRPVAHDAANLTSAEKAALLSALGGPRALSGVTVVNTSTVTIGDAHYGKLLTVATTGGATKNWTMPSSPPIGARFAVYVDPGVTVNLLSALIYDHKASGVSTLTNADNYAVFEFIGSVWVAVRYGNLSVPAANITGVISIASGGTGSATQNFVGLTGTQTVAGAKTWSGQQEGTGQAATNGTSFMTRDLVDARVSGPKFYAKSNALQAVPTSTNTKLNWGSEDWDTANCFDTANGRFTPNKAGYYQINISIRAEPNVNSTIVAIAKNGAIHRYLVQANNHTYITFCAAALVSMNGSTDYLEVWVWHNKGSDLNINTSNGEHAQFSGSYLP